MKKYGVLLSLLLALALLAGCSSGTAEGGSTQIVLSDSGIEIKGGGAKASGSSVLISAVGSYTVSGSLSDGQIVVDTGDDAMDVTLILNGADISCLSGPAIHIRQAENARLQLAEGSVNRLCSGTEGSAADPDASGAALYAEDDLDIDGPGSLEVRGYINNGIACKNDLDINGGSIAVLAVNNGLRGSDSVEIKGGELSVEAGNDGVKSTEADKEGKGYVLISGGSLTVSAAGDGLSAETELRLEGGTVAVTTTGDPAQVSSKAAKAGTGLTVSGGELSLSSSDHALHSAAGLTVSGGTVQAQSSQGKALAAHGNIEISGGELSLSALDDGIETPGDILLSGGAVTLAAGDDGLQAGEANTGRGTVTLQGGELKISAKGRALNARGSFALEGGSLIALGGSDKVTVLSSGSQPFIQAGWNGAAGAETALLGASDEALLSLIASYPYRTILLSSPQLQAGESYRFSKGSDAIDVTAQLP